MRVGWSAPGTPWPQAEDGAVSWSEWFNMHNQNFVCGKYNQMTLEFVAPLDGQARVWVEGKCKWGYSNNWFMDAFALEAVETVGMPAPAPNPPVAPPSDALRLYFLLPETLAPELAMAALWVAQELRATVGFSPDDAGAGGPRRVIGVLPAQSGAWLDQTWYAQRYPGVQYVTLDAAADANELMARLRALATAVG